MRFRQFIEAIPWAPGPAQQVPGYQQASPQGQQMIQGMQNSLNNLNDPMFQRTAQRAQMPMSQQMADIRAQAQQDYPAPQKPTIQQTLQRAYNDSQGLLRDLSSGEFERRRLQGQQQQGQQQQGQQQQGQQQQGGRCPTCGQAVENPLGRLGGKIAGAVGKAMNYATQPTQQSKSVNPTQGH